MAIVSVNIKGQKESLVSSSTYELQTKKQAPKEKERLMTPALKILACAA
jgi:hypothetical protein